MANSAQVNIDRIGAGIGLVALLLVFVAIATFVWLIAACGVLIGNESTSRVLAT